MSPIPAVLMAASLLAGCATTTAAPGLSPEAETGRRIAASSCAGCHSASGARAGLHRGAPEFWAMAGRHTPESLRRSIADPANHDQNGMPAIVLTESEAAAVFAYIEALGRADPGVRSGLDVPPCVAIAAC